MSGVGIISGQSAKHEGLDYSLQRSATDVYSSMMPTRTHIQNQTLTDRRTGGENQVYNTYDPSHPSAQTHSALNYPNSGSSAPNPHSQQMNKTGTSGTSTSPPQSTWTPRHLNRPEAYNQSVTAYNQISPPSRSPSGPTYTQLNSAPGSRGMWGQWHNNAGPEAPTTSASVVSHPSTHGNASAGNHGTGGPHQPQELSDMLQMLGQSEPTSFEELSMFNTFTE